MYARLFVTRPTIIIGQEQRASYTRFVCSGKAVLAAEAASQLARESHNTTHTQSNGMRRIRLMRFTVFIGLFCTQF